MVIKYILKVFKEYLNIVTKGPIIVELILHFIKSITTITKGPIILELLLHFIKVIK